MENTLRNKEGIMSEELEEYWKDIPGYEGRYIASNTGKIRVIKEKYQRTHRGKLITVPNGKCTRDTIVGRGLSKKGYLRVNLGGKIMQAHRVIALTFIPNPENKEQVNHVDGDKTNNNISNLEWATNIENRRHAVKNKLISHGEKSPKSKLKLDQVKDIIAKHKEGLKAKEIAKIYNITPSHVRSIVHGKIWKLSLD